MASGAAREVVKEGSSGVSAHLRRHDLPND